MKKNASLNICNCICDAEFFLFISVHIRRSWKKIKHKKRINSAKAENNEILQWSNATDTVVFFSLFHAHTPNTKMNKSTKVWLNSRSKHNWKLKYKRWQNNCFVADDHTGIVITPLPHCNCHWRSVKHWSRQTTQPKPLNADVKKKCTHRFLRLTTFRLWHWIEWTFHELYTKTDGWPPAAGPNQIHSIDILYDHHHHHYRQQRYDMKSHEPMHVITKIIPKTRFRVVIYLLPPNAHHVRDLVRYGDKAKSTFFLKKKIKQTD